MAPDPDSLVTDRRTVYDFLDDWAGDRFDTRSLRRVSTMTVDRLDQFIAHYSEWQPSLKSRQLSPGELRPLLWNRFQRVDTLSGDALPSAPNRNQTLRMVLVYAHGVAIPSELQTVVNRATRSRDFFDPRTVHFTLSGYAQLRDLSEVGAVDWLEEHSIAESKVPTKELYEILPGLEFDYSDVDLGPNFSLGNGMMAFGCAVNELLLALRYSDDGTADLVMRHPFFERVFRQMLDHSLPMPMETSTLGTLVTIGVPDLEPPELEDVLTVRKHNDRFVEWRNALGDSLRAAMAVSGDDLDSVKAALVERLTPEAERLTIEVRRSSALSGFTTGAAAFGLSGLGSTVGLALGSNPTPGIAGSLASGIVGGIVAHVRARSARRLNRALLAHYLTFTRDDHQRRSPS